MTHRLREENGFTMIETLVVVAIIALLATIAIPQFVSYRKRIFEGQVKEDLRNGAAAQESYYADNRAYKTGALTSGTPPGYNRSVPITIESESAGYAFTLTASHASCIGVSWLYASTNGVITGGPVLSPNRSCSHWAQLSTT